MFVLFYITSMISTENFERNKDDFIEQTVSFHEDINRIFGITIEPACHGTMSEVVKKLSRSCFNETKANEIQEIYNFLDNTARLRELRKRNKIGVNFANSGYYSKKKDNLENKRIEGEKVFLIKSNKK